MERKIGEIFELKGEWYQCVEGMGCCQCAFNQDEVTCLADNPYCTDRSDRKDVVFKKLKKAGEPYKLGEVLIQQYQGIVPVVLPDDSECSSIFRVISSINVIEIIIKQKQEDMEEKKIQHYDCFFDRKPTLKELNLKEFDLEAAKAGKPVCTKDGRKARIICFDRNDLYPIVALIECEDGKEILGEYSNEGRTEIYETKGIDLMMLPEKKEGWVNVYYNRTDGITFSKHPYPSKEEAIKNAGTMSNIIDTVNISWKE